MNQRVIHGVFFYLEKVRALKAIFWFLFTLTVHGFSFAYEVKSQSFWEDPTSAANFKYASVQNYTPYTGVLTKGFTNSSFWIKLSIESNTPATSKIQDPSKHLENLETYSSDLILRIRPNYLDLIELYDPDVSTESPIQTTGDMTTWRANQPYQSIDHNLLVKNITSNKTVFLRFKTLSNSQIYIDCESPEDFIVSNNFFSLVYSSTISLLCFFLVWIFVNWLIDKSSLNLLFAIKQCIFIIYSFCFFGYHRIFIGDLLSPQAINSFYNAWIEITVMSSLWFESRFLKLNNAPKWSDALSKLLLIWGMVDLLVLFNGFTLGSLFSHMILIGVGVLSLFFSALFIKDQSQQTKEQRHIHLNKWIIVTYFCINTLVVMVFVIPGLGLSKVPAMNIYSVISYGLTSGIMMTMLLHIRSKNIIKHRADDALSLKLSIEQIEIEKTKRKEQTDFLHMLMHELKTPLSVLDLVLHSTKPSEKKHLHASRAIKDMKSIIDRCVDADQLQENKLIVKKEAIHIRSLIEDVLDAEDIDKWRCEIQGEMDPIVFSDFQFLRIILGNLIHNAFRYGAKHEKVFIHITMDHQTHTNNHMLITIINSPDEGQWPDPSKIFEKYYRSPGAQKQSGTGLGLFLVNNLCSRIDAICTYDPTPTHIQFKVWIPH